jgi:transcriptional regulator with XRE-family HTH domain
LSQFDLAEAADVAQTTLSRLENGTTSAQPRTLRKLAKVLRVDPAELIGPEEIAS